MTRQFYIAQIRGAQKELEGLGVQPEDEGFENLTLDELAELADSIIEQLKVRRRFVEWETQLKEMKINAKSRQTITQRSA